MKQLDPRYSNWPNSDNDRPRCMGSFSVGKTCQITLNPDDFAEKETYVLRIVVTHGKYLEIEQNVRSRVIVYNSLFFHLGIKAK